MVIVGAIATAVGIGVALAIHWFPASASTQAGPIDTLWYVLLGISIPIFVGVVVVTLFSVRLFRVRPGQELEDGAPIHGNTKLEVVWTAIPATLLVGLVVYSYLVLHHIEKAPAKAAQERQVAVQAQQFAWQYEYRGPDGKPLRSHELYLPVGQSVRFNITTKDVLHDFWVPQFRMKVDAVPGITTHYRVTPNREGTYEVVCAELCGLGHAFMRSPVHVVSAQEFDAWLDKLANPAAAGGGGGSGGGGEQAAVDGKQIFVNGNGTATPCSACHTLADAGSTGTTGPDLDKAIADADAAEIRNDIVNPNAQIYPGFQGGIMPQDYGQTLSSAELDALVKYLDKVTSK
jgi:cytochrome c oxidase subunit 2